MRWKYISATKFEKDSLIEKAINLNIWKGISNRSLPFLFSEKFMQRMLYLLQGWLSFILPELAEIKSDSNLIKNECHCILRGAEKTGQNHIITHAGFHGASVTGKTKAQRNAVNEGMRAKEGIKCTAKYTLITLFLLSQFKSKHNWESKKKKTLQLYRYVQDNNNKQY